MTVEHGQFTDSEILVMLGENGTGKTTFIRMLAGKLDPDAGSGKFDIGYLWILKSTLSFSIQFQPMSLF